MSKKEIIIYSIIAISFFLNICLIFKPKEVKVEYIKDDYAIDTIYYKIVKDTIIYNIKKQDSIVYVIKEKMKYEIKEVSNYNDSCTVELFNKLSWE